MAKECQKTFIGRGRELEKIQRSIRKQNSVTIVGPAGVGKTEIGHELAQRMDPLAIFWYDFASDANIDIGLVLWKLAAFLKIHNIEEPWNWLKSKEYVNVPLVNRRINFFISHLCDKKFVLCFDDVHHVLDSPHKNELLRLFQICARGLGMTRMLLMSRTAFPTPPENTVLKGMSLPDFTDLLSDLLRDFPCDVPAGDDDGQTLGQALWEKLGGNPQYLRLFADAVYDEPLDIDSVRASLQNIPSLHQVANYLLEQVKAQLSADEWLILSASTIFRHPPDITLLADILRRSRLLKNVTDVERAIRYDLGSQRLLLTVKNDGAHLHNLLAEFCQDTLDAQTELNLHHAVTAIYEDEPPRLSPLEAAYHYLKAKHPVKSFEVLQKNLGRLVESGQAGGVLTQLECFKATQFQDRPHLWIQILILRGNLQRHLGRYREAVDSHGKAQREARKYERLILQAESLNELGRDLISWDRLKPAIKTLNQALALLQESSAATLQGAIYCGLGLAHGKLKQYKKERDYANASIPLLRDTGEYRRLLQAYDLLIEAYGYLGELDQASAALEEAEMIALQEGLSKSPEMGLIYSDLGFVYYRAGKPEKAKPHLQKAVALNETIGDLERRVANSGRLGVLLYSTCNLEESEIHLQRAVDLATLIESHYYWFVFAYSLISLSQAQGRWDDTSEYLREAKTAAETANDWAMWHIAQAYLLRDRALLAQEEEKAERAVAHWQAALEHLEQVREAIATPKKFGQGDVLDDMVPEHQIILSEILVGMGERFDEAISAITEACKIIEEKQFGFLKGSAWQALGAVHGAREEWVDADKAFDKALEIFEECEDRYEQARTHYYRGKRNVAQGKLEEAQAAWRTSLELFEGLTAPGRDNDYIRLVKAALKRYNMS